jgi:hypothetical protein
MRLGRSKMRVKMKAAMTTVTGGWAAALTRRLHDLRVRKGRVSLIASLSRFRQSVGADRRAENRLVEDHEFGASVPKDRCKFIDLRHC